MNFDLTSTAYKSWLTGTKHESRILSIFKPEYGQQVLALQNTGIMLSQLDRKQEAVEAFHQALVLAPDDVVLLDLFAQSLADCDRKEEAIGIYQKALRLDPKDYNLYQSLGTRFLELDRNEEALETYKKALSINPTDSYLHFLVAYTYGLLDKLHDAKEYYEKYITLADPAKDEAFIESARDQLVAIKSIEEDKAE